MAVQGDVRKASDIQRRFATASLNGPGTELDKQQVVAIAESCMSNLLT
jgi:hypothetical protein